MRLASGLSARCRIAVLGLAATAASPHGYVNALPRTQQARQATDCPEQAAFVSAPVRSFTINAPPDSAWSVINTALQRWYRESFFVATRSVAAARPVTLIVDDERRSLTKQQRRVTAVSGRTCFLQRRVGRRDYRIAFSIDVRSVTARMPQSEVHVRWLSSYKGSSERTWRADAREATDHFEALRQVIAASLPSRAKGS